MSIPESLRAHMGLIATPMIDPAVWLRVRRNNMAEAIRLMPQDVIDRAFMRGADAWEDQICGVAG